MIKKMKHRERYHLQTGTRIIVQVPTNREQALISEVLNSTHLKYGDYDSVTFTSAPGKQRFRSLGTGHNKATAKIVEVPSVEISFFVDHTVNDLDSTIRAIYNVHPYEEPVIYLDEVKRTLHVRGTDDANPNRFWNLPDADWMPSEIREGDN